MVAINIFKTLAVLAIASTASARVPIFERRHWGFGATGTGLPGPTGTGIPGPTGTGIPGPTGTGVSQPSGTGAPQPSGTGAYLLKRAPEEAKFIQRDGKKPLNEPWFV